MAKATRQHRRATRRTAGGDGRTARRGDVHAQRGDADGGAAVAHARVRRDPAPSAPDGDTRRLRARGLRRMHRAARRQARAVVPGARGEPRGPGGHHRRGSRRTRRHPASGAAGVHRLPRSAVRILHSRLRDHHRRVPRGERFTHTARRPPTRSRATSAGAPDTRTSGRPCCVPRRSSASVRASSRSARTTSRRGPHSIRRSAARPTRSVEGQGEHERHETPHRARAHHGRRRARRVGEVVRQADSPHGGAGSCPATAATSTIWATTRSSPRSSGHRTRMPASRGSTSMPHSICLVCTRSTRTTTSWTTPRKWRRTSPS